MADEDRNQAPKRLLLKVDGMHCPNCEVLIERRFKKLAGVCKVSARQATSRVEVVHSGDVELETLRKTIAGEPYTVSLWQEPKRGALSGDKKAGPDYLEIGAAFLIVVGLYLALVQFDVLPDRVAIPSTISYGLAFVVGLVASMSTCIAVIGGLLIAVAAKYNAAHGNLTSAQRFKPHIYFNVGRIVFYTVLGGAVGALGSTLTLSAEANGILVIAASVIMIALGLQMLGMLPSLGISQPRMPKFLAHKIHNLSEKETKRAAFLLGASTFFLPCGFTQALQLYVLSKGSIETGAMTMLAFVLGTLPALLSLSAVSSFATGAFQRYFLKFAGVSVVMLGIFNIQSGLTLTDVGSGASIANVSAAKQTNEASLQPVPIIDGKQIAEMKVIGYTYQPHEFAVVAGVPVEWRIDATRAAGCGRILIAPGAGFRRFLSSTDTTVLTFNPREPGEIRFNCGMGMMTRGSKFIVRANAAAELPAATPAPIFSSGQRADIERITQGYLASPEVNATIDENLKLAEAIHVSGTPSYVVGSEVVVGAIGLEGLKQKIDAARQ